MAATCIKCKKVMLTEHHSGMCRPCRAVEHKCKQCGRKVARRPTSNWVCSICRSKNKTLESGWIR